MVAWWLRRGTLGCLLASSQIFIWFHQRILDRASRQPRRGRRFSRSQFSRLSSQSNPLFFQEFRRRLGCRRFSRPFYLPAGQFHRCSIACWFRWTHWSSKWLCLFVGRVIELEPKWWLGTQEILGRSTEELRSKMWQFCLFLTELGQWCLACWRRGEFPSVEWWRAFRNRMLHNQRGTVNASEYVGVKVEFLEGVDSFESCRFLNLLLFCCLF